MMWDPYTGETKQIISMHFPLPHYVFPSQVLGIEISQFGHAIANLSDKGHIYLWNPLSMQLRMSEPDCVLNTTPEDEIVIEDDAAYRSIKLAMAEKCLLVPSFSSSKAHVISMKYPAPPLKHLCRLTVRKIVPNTIHLNRLKLPSRLMQYLKYNAW